MNLKKFEKICFPNSKLTFGRGERYTLYSQDDIKVYKDRIANTFEEQFFLTVENKILFFIT